MTHLLWYHSNIIYKFTLKRGIYLLRFVLGKSGTGKTEYLYNKLTELAQTGENRIIMLIPDQSSFETEKVFLDRLGAKKCQNVKVFGFSRFCHYVFDTVNFEQKNVIDDSTRAVIMSLALEQLDTSLEMFANSSGKKSVIDSMLSALKECKKAKISTEALRNVSALIDDKTLKTKLRETALIIDTFDAIVEQSYIDPLDNLTRVAEILKEKNMFNGFTLAVDSFSGFSVQQLEVLKLLFTQCESTYVALTLNPYEDEEQSLFSTTNDTYKRLKAIAKSENVEIKAPVKLEENFRNESEELKILEKNFYQNKSNEYELKNDSITAFSADTVYGECEFVARQIKRLVLEQGYLYSDIAVICRDIAPYTGVLNTIFDKYEIPYFMDMSYDIYIKPVIRYVCSIFNAVLNGWQKDDLLAILKTGLSNNSNEEISAFENYVYVWNINGAAFKKPFANNPDGFSETMSDSQTEQLEMAENVRKGLVEPLEKFREDIKDKTGREITELLYNLLERLEVTKAISAMYDKLKADGELAQAKEEIRLWNLLMNTFDQMVAVAGDLKVSPKRYFELLSLRLSVLKIADIPRTVDSVSVGTATRVRLNKEKAVFLIGCIDGVFPAVPSTAGLFSAYELKTLIANNLPFGDEPAELADFENYMAYKSATSPSQKLFVSFYKSDLTGGTYMQSSIINEVVSIFPNIALHREEEYCSVKDSTWAILPAFEECARNFNSDSEENRALKNYFANNEIFKDKYKALQNASTAKPFVFDDKINVNLLFGSDLKISASQVEKFSLCRFSYFCNYGLRVRERRKAEINPLEYGTFIHYIMEIFFSKYSKNEFSNMSEDEIYDICDGILDDYVDKHFGGTEKNTPRFMYRFNKIRENVHFLVLHIIKELKHSGFEPIDCELKIDGDIPGYEVALPTGQKIMLRGSVDRVDILKKGEENYIRIIDYKTGSKEFKLSDILYGLNLQMLIYLYAITLGGEERYGKVTPAGILYMPATVKPISVDGAIIDAQINEQVSKGLKMNGMLLNSLDVIDNSDKEYISFNTKKGTLTTGGNLASLEELGMIFKKLDMTVAEMGDKLFSGNVEASPLKGGKDSCEYCPYDSVCAYHMSACRNSFSVDNDEVCKILENEQNKGGED